MCKYRFLTRYTDKRGFPCELEIISDENTELMKRADALLDWIVLSGGQPITQAAPAPAAATAAKPPEEPPLDPAWCPIHETKMTKHTKDNQVWYSHKGPDGEWCRGKAPKNGK